MVRDNTLVSSNIEGLDKVRKGGFAFFIESPRLDYEVGRNCDLVQVGKLLNSRYYAIGLQPGMKGTLQYYSVSICPKQLKHGE